MILKILLLNTLNVNSYSGNSSSTTNILEDIFKNMSSNKEMPTVELRNESNPQQTADELVNWYTQIMEKYDLAELNEKIEEYK
jgi:hypothetical protein